MLLIASTLRNISFITSSKTAENKEAKSSGVYPRRLVNYRLALILGDVLSWHSDPTTSPISFNLNRTYNGASPASSCSKLKLIFSSKSDMYAPGQSSESSRQTSPVSRDHNPRKRGRTACTRCKTRKQKVSSNR